MAPAGKRGSASMRPHALQHWRSSSARSSGVGCEAMSTGVGGVGEGGRVGGAGRGGGLGEVRTEGLEERGGGEGWG